MPQLCCHEIFLILNLCATVRHKNLKPKGLPTPLPPFSQPDPKISGFLTTSFNMLSLWKTLNEETFRMSLEPLQCPICLDPLRGLPSWKEVLSTPCGHLFCNTCLVTALRYGFWLCNCSNSTASSFFWKQECLAMPFVQKEDQG